MLFCTLQFYGSGCGDFLKKQNSQRRWLFHTGRSEPVRWSMEKCHINVLLRLAEMWRLTPGYWFIRGLTGEAMDLALAATIKPFEMSRNQRSREMVSAYASGRNDDTLWCVARPEYNDSSTGHDAQTAVLFCVVPPDSPLLQKNMTATPWFRPQSVTQKSTDKLFISGTPFSSSAPSTTKTVFFFPAIQGLWRNINHTIIVTEQLK